jgi:hypothetical protein
MTALWGSGCTDLRFLDLGTVGGEWLASRPCRFTPRKRAHDTQRIGDWANPRAGMDDMEK